MKFYVVLLVMLAGCMSEIGETQQQQYDPGIYRWTKSMMYTSDGGKLAEVLIIGGQDIGAFEANTEYWYVNKTRLRDLGRVTLSLSMTSGDADPPEPDLGDNVQIFTQPVYPTGGWGNGFLRDIFRGGFLYQNADNIGLRLFLSNGEISRVIWYQAVPHGSQPYNIRPTGVFRTSPFFSIPGGSLGYAIDLLAD
jgi:hypothetical protein